MRFQRLKVAALLLCCLAGGLVLILLLISNFTFLIGSDFKGRLTDGNATKDSITLSVSGKPSRIYFPGTKFQIYAESKPPRDLNVRIETGINNILSAQLERVSLRTGKKTTELLSPNQDLILFFKERSYPTWDGQAIVHSKSLVAESVITNCIPGNLPVVVECSAILRNSAGEETRVSNIWTFEPKKVCGFVPSYYLDSLNGGPPSGYPGP